jgi:hypothetical protein
MSCILQMGPLTERVQQRLSGHEVLAYWQGDAETLLAEHAGRIEIMVTSAISASAMTPSPWRPPGHGAFR